jgi:3-acetyloctanal synthase
VGPAIPGDASVCPRHRFVVFSLGKHSAFHRAVRQALTDLTRGSARTLTGDLPPAPDDEPAGPALPAHTAILAKALRFLDVAVPDAGIHLVTAETAADAVRAAGALELPAGDPLVTPLVLIDADGAGLSTAPFEESVTAALADLAAALPGHLDSGLASHHAAVYTEDHDRTLQVARPYPLRRLPTDRRALTSEVVCLFTDHLQRWLARSATRAARRGTPALATALHGFLTAEAGPAWGLHYYTGSVVSGLIRDLDRLAEDAGNPVLRGPSEHSLACGALARWQLDSAPFLIVVTSGMVDEFRGTLANLRDARARGFIVCADSAASAWFPFQGTVHAAEDSRAVLAARNIPYVYLDDPARLPADLQEAYRAYRSDRGPVVLLATAAVLDATAAGTGTEPGPETAAGTPPERPVPLFREVREDALAPVAELVNRDPVRLLWQCGSLGAEESDLVHDLARRAGIGLADSLTRPGSVAGYRDGRPVPEYLGTLGVYGFSARVHDYLHRGGRLRPPGEQCLFFLKSRIPEAATPFSPRALKRALRIVQVTREADHLAPCADHPVHADALSFLRGLRERLDVDPEVLAARRDAIASTRDSASDALHELPVLPMSANYFFAHLRQRLEELITTRGYTYTGVYDVGRGGLSAVRNLPRTGPGFSGWYGRALMGDALQAAPAIALTRDDNVLAFVGDGASALVPDIVPSLVQQVCLHGRRLRRNLTVFRLIDGGHSVIRTYHEGRTDSGMSRQTQVLHLLEPEWTRSYGGLTVRHHHLDDMARPGPEGLLERPATVDICSVPLAHNNEGDGLSLLSAHGWQRDELSELSFAMFRAAAKPAPPGTPGTTGPIRRPG